MNNLQLNFVIIPQLYNKEEIQELIEQDLTCGEDLVKYCNKTHNGYDIRRLLEEAAEHINKSSISMQVACGYNYSDELVIIEAIKESVT